MNKLAWFGLGTVMVAFAMSAVACSDDDGDDGGTGGTGGAGSGGTGGASGFDAAAFCATYETTCTFGGAQRFADMADCTTKVATFSAARQTCIQTHVGLASSDTTTHCPHATGLSTNAATCGP